MTSTVATQSPNLPLIPTAYDGVSTATSVSQLETEYDHAMVLKGWGKTGPAVDDLKRQEGELENDAEADLSKVEE